MRAQRNRGHEPAWGEGLWPSEDTGGAARAAVPRQPHSLLPDAQGEGHSAFLPQEMHTNHRKVAAPWGTGWRCHLNTEARQQNIPQ